MAYDYCDLLADARHWARSAIEHDVLDTAMLDAVFSDDHRGAEPLFGRDGDSARPMIVAFMGGTGVGKSALINRLAGQTIANSGIERPTSREVTLYHHRSLPIDRLPPGLPLDKIRLSPHADDKLRAIAFIDMPDFDSVEQGNKTLTLQWLPHIDVLLYIVSPERYRDVKAWQLLLAEGGRHAWLFVMNQWDRAAPEQLDDFRRQLHKAGFADPVILRTSCTQPENDDFADLLTQLQQLATRQTLAAMTQHHDQTRRQELAVVLDDYQQLLLRQDFQALTHHVDEAWPRLTEELQRGLTWPLTRAAQALASSAGLADSQEVRLWDDWAQTNLNDALEDICLQADHHAIAPGALKIGFEILKANAGKQVSKQAALSARQAMVKPGNGLQRWSLRLAAIMEVVLPLGAMTTVGYQVFAGFYHGAIGTAAFLGVDFAVHASLLIAVSWLLPYFLGKKLAPSIERAACKGLQQGLSRALADIRQDVAQQIKQRQALRDRCLQDLQTIRAQCLAKVDLQPGLQASDQSALARVMPQAVVLGSSVDTRD
ncbi:MAG: 50S ribosome-binding GTPase [Methylomonas sp.]|nr:50S ribosome-binding GTPase [Methylomonas sp.]PPD20653.1 MAG: GTP-binding protein [Methylomonas sp.]PPD25521.1 MAG: GTP-binding protein [Methylomonas sp.]PPD36315.1 MAG: GTP-binding protein [Methylomonas sp.]PPD40237.1 MAG: GTP-binding protein [Methylomonas sp.]